MRKKSATPEVATAVPVIIGDFEFAIIKMVNSLADTAYGAEIHRALEQTLARKVAIAQVFNTLDRLRTKGALDCDAVPPAEGDRGPHRNVYRLTPIGQKLLWAANQDAAKSGTPGRFAARRQFAVTP